MLYADNALPNWCEGVTLINVAATGNLRQSHHLMSCNTHYETMCLFQVFFNNDAFVACSVANQTVTSLTHQRALTTTNFKKSSNDTSNPPS
jgi:hypothetical protein